MGCATLSLWPNSLGSILAHSQGASPWLPYIEIVTTRVRLFLPRAFALPGFGEQVVFLTLTLYTIDQPVDHVSE